MLKDRRVERNDVVAFLQHRPPPLGFDVVLQQHAVVAVVVGRAKPAVNLRGGEDEAAPFAERDDLLHRDSLGSGLLIGACHGGTVSAAIIAPRHADLRVQMRQRPRLRRDSEDERRVVERVPGVRRPAERVLHPVAIHFKGSGFHNTDYGKKKTGTNGSSEGSSSESSKDSSDSKTSDSTSSASKSPAKAE